MTLTRAIAAALLVVSLASCGDDGSATKADNVLSQASSSASPASEPTTPSASGWVESFGDGAMQLELTEAEYLDYMDRLGITAEDLDIASSSALDACQHDFLAEDYAAAIASGIGTSFENEMMMSVGLGVRHYCPANLGNFAAGAATLQSALENLDGFCKYSTDSLVTNDGQTFDEMDAYICGN